ncbi:hypothetical protein ACOME3_001394 [Neoechinorhynchus agilis]
MCSTSCDGTIRIWSLDSGLLIKSFELLPKSNDINHSKLLSRPCIAFVGADEDEVFAVPVELSVAIIANLNSPNLSNRIANVDDPKDGPQAVAYSNTHCVLAVAFSNGRIIMFNQSLEQPSRALFFIAKPNPICQLVFANDLPGELWIIAKQGNIGMIKSSTITSAINSPVRQNTDDDVVTMEPMTYGNGEERRTILLEWKSLGLEKQQPYFQTASTPSHLDQALLVWNRLGIVLTYTKEETIIVEFHNSLHHHNFNVANPRSRFNKASLSTQALTLAGDRHLKCMIYRGKWAGMEWDVKSVGEDDYILGVCSMDERIFVITSSQTIKVFTNAGRPSCPSLCIPGTIVTSTSTAKSLAVFYYSSYSMRCMVFDFDLSGDVDRVCYSIDVEVSIHCDLIWCCFGETDNRHLYYVDNESNLRVIQRTSCSGGGCVAMFIQNLTRLKPEDRSGYSAQTKHYWPVSIHENSSFIICIQCKCTYPDVLTPRPMPVRLPLFVETNFGLREKHIDQSQSGHADNGVLSYLLYKTHEKSDHHFIEHLLKAFQLSCKYSNDMKAAQLLTFMDTKCLRSALKCADRLGRRRVIDEINEMISKVTTTLTMNDDEPDVDVIEEPSIPILKPSTLTDSLKEFSKQKIENATNLAKWPPFKTSPTTPSSRISIFSKIGESSHIKKCNLNLFLARNNPLLGTPPQTNKKRSAFEIFYEEHISEFKDQSEAVTAFVRLAEDVKKRYVEMSLERSDQKSCESEPMDWE